MPDTTFEQAKRCPKCGVPGEDMVQRAIGGGNTAHFIQCQNEACRWFETRWIVQLNADGSIPVRKPGDKDYDVDTGKRMDTVGRHYMEDVLQADSSEHGEIRNPFA